MRHEEYKEMLELAALDAFGGDDTRVLQEHLATCDECRVELAELRDAAAMLMFYGEPVTPSAELSARILNTLHTTPGIEQIPDYVVSEDRHKGKSNDGEQSSAASGFALQPQSWRQRRSGASWLGALAAALILAVLVVALIVLWSRNHAMQAEMTRLSSRNDEMQAELNHLKQSNDELQAELARTAKQNNELQAELNHLPNRNKQPEVTPNPRAPGLPPINENDSSDVELFATSVAPRAHARLVYNSRTGVIELTVSNMPPAPAGKTYQLWLLVGGHPYSGGTFITGPGGRAMLRGQVAAAALEASAFAVTLEPAGGSDKPTGLKYLLGSAL